VLRPFNRSIHLWLVVFAAAGFVYFGVHGVLFGLYLLRLGFEPQFIGLLVGTGQIMFALLALPSGEIGRRFGVRGALIAGLVLLSVAYALMLCVEGLPHSAWVPWLFLWWALVWVGAALANVNSVPYAMSLAGDSAPRAFAVQSAVIGITSFAGSLIGAGLVSLVADLTGTSIADPAPFRIVLWLTPIAFLTSGVALLAAERVPAVASAEGSSSRDRSPLGVFILLGIVVFLFTSGEGVLRAFFNVYLDVRLAATPTQIGVTMGLAQLLPIAASLAVPALVARFGTGLTLTIASIVAAAGLVVLGAVPVLVFSGASYMVAMSMVAVHGATRNVFSQEIVAGPWRTTTAAILTVGMGLGWAISAAAGGILVGAIDFRGLFYVTGGLAAIGAIITSAYQRATSRREALTTFPEVEHA
jgi:MFS family permease